jgi:galactokinase
MKTLQVVEAIKQEKFDDRLLDIYADSRLLDYEGARYIRAIQRYSLAFDEGSGYDVEIFSAPGKCEIGGNHTDDQRGEILAASINRDMIAVVQKIKRPVVTVLSDALNAEIRIDLEDLGRRKEEEGSTAALIRGVLARIKETGYSVGGFQAYIASDVLIGAGLSSSAAFETLIGTVVSCLYNSSEISPVEIAKIGQYAENIYFAKPCGLMDQMVCSVGSLVYIDFWDTRRPKVERIQVDLEKYGYSLCITNTTDSYADLAPDYAAIPEKWDWLRTALGRMFLARYQNRNL